MEDIDEELELEVLDRVAQREEQSLSFSFGEDSNRPLIEEAKALTGGYIFYLRDNTVDLMRAISTPQENLERIKNLARFVSFVRARPSKNQDEKHEREFSPRLVSQHVRLAKCLAAVLNKKTVDKEVMRRVKKVALDTARGITLEILKKLYDHHEEGMSNKLISAHVNQPEDRVRKLMRFLRGIGVAFQRTKRRGKVRQEPRWYMQKSMLKLYEEVME